MICINSNWQNLKFSLYFKAIGNKKTSCELFFSSNPNGTK